WSPAVRRGRATPASPSPAPASCMPLAKWASQASARDHDSCLVLGRSRTRTIRAIGEATMLPKRTDLCTGCTGGSVARLPGGAVAFDGAEERVQKAHHLLRLLLLNPMPGMLDQMTAAHVGAGLRLHPLQSTGGLMDAPVATAGDEARRHVDAAAREDLQLGDLQS